LLTIIITQKQIVIISVFREILMILRPLATEATLALFYEKRVKKSWIFFLCLAKEILKSTPN